MTRFLALFETTLATLSMRGVSSFDIRLRAHRCWQKSRVGPIGPPLVGTVGAGRVEPAFVFTAPLSGRHAEQDDHTVAFALYADFLWTRDEAADWNACNCPAHTVLPRATGVHRVNPDQWLAYNLSPRFNWDALALGRKDIKNFVSQLGR